jgi:hypothetical protein
MRSAVERQSEEAEQVVRDIRRASRREYPGRREGADRNCGAARRALTNYVIRQGAETVHQPAFILVRAGDRFAQPTSSGLMSNGKPS